MTFKKTVAHLADLRDQAVARLRQAPENPAALSEKLELEAAIRCLEACEQSGAVEAKHFVRLPEVEATFGEFRILWDFESEDRKQWQELRISERPIRAVPGDVICLR